MARTKAEIQKAYEKRSGWAANRKYQEKVMYRVGLMFNRNTEPDIIEYLSGIENKTDYIRGLIRADMESQK